MNPYLIIARVGDKSLHPEWLTGKSPNFDLFLSYFGDEPNKYRQQAKYYEQVKGAKWPELARIMFEHAAIIARYDAIWLPDDDLLIDARDINKMFHFFDAFELDLAQPSLSKKSYFSYSLTLTISKNLIRYVNFVENMAPIFSRSGLQQLQHTFSMSPSGWGLNWLWPRLLENKNKRKIAILDAIQIVHTRPVGGELYKMHPEMSPKHDLSVLIERFSSLNIAPSSSINKFRVYAQARVSEYKIDIISRLIGKYQRKKNRILYKNSTKYTK